MMNATPGFPCSEYHCSILPSRYRSTVSRTSSGRTANTCDWSNPGLMVPIARILVVGVVFIAAPCALAELKPAKQQMSAKPAARASFMLSPFRMAVRRSGERVGTAYGLAVKRVGELFGRPDSPTSAAGGGRTGAKVRFLHRNRAVETIELF